MEQYFTFGYDSIYRKLLFFLKIEIRGIHISSKTRYHVRYRAMKVYVWSIVIHDRIKRERLIEVHDAVINDNAAAFTDGRNVVDTLFAFIQRPRAGASPILFIPRDTQRPRKFVC